MLPKLFENIWASGGDTGSPPNAAKIALGWVKERVKYTRWNWLQKRLENQIYGIIENGPGSWYPAASDPFEMISSGLWDESWGITSDTINTIAGGSAKEYRDLAVYFDSDNQPYILAADNATQKIDIYNARTKASVLTTDDLKNDLPSGSSETWEFVSILVSDGALYGLFTDTNASPDTHIIQKWLIDLDSGNWDTPWLTTGTALPGTGNGLSSYARDGTVIKASSTKIATLNGWNVISASSSAAVSIINASDGVIDASGAGDAPTGTSAQGLHIASDGTNIFFSADSGSDTAICTATIADPTTGSGGTGYPYTHTGYFSTGALVSCGPNMVVGAFNKSSIAVTDEIVRTFDSGNASNDVFERGQDTKSTPTSGDHYIYERSLGGFFDGAHAWILSYITIVASIYPCLLRLDASKMLMSPNTTAAHQRDLDHIVTGVYFVDPGNALPSLGTDTRYTKSVFDGESIWTIIEPRSSQTNSGNIFRLPRALVRH